MQELLGCEREQLLALMKHIVVARWSDSFGHPGIYGCEYDGLEFFVKLAPYDNLEYDARKPIPAGIGFQHPVDAEINIMRALKTHIIDTGISPHIIEILAVRTCSNIREMIVDRAQCKKIAEGEEEIDNMPSSLLCILQERITRGTAIDRVALIFSEVCAVSLPNFVGRFLPLNIQERDTMLVAFAFQVYYTLLAITRIWPQFSHGDMLNLSNLMIKSAEPTQNWPKCGHYLRYVIPHTIDAREDSGKSSVFDIPYNGLFLKIIDFGHSQIPEEHIISAVEQNRQERAQEFIPDHIDFIRSYKELQRNSGLPTIILPKMFETLNPHHIRKEMVLRVQVELAAKSPTVEDSFASHGGAFEIFRAHEGDHQGLILQTYRAPISKKKE